MIENIIAGALGGLAYGVSGWLKHRKHNQGINFKKLGLNSVIGLVWGLISGFGGLEVGVVATGTMGTAVSALLQNLWRGIFK